MRRFNRERGNVNTTSESRRGTTRGGQRDRQGRNFERFEDKRQRRGDYRRSTPYEKISDGYDKIGREGRGSLRIEDRLKNDDFSQRTRHESGTFLDRKNEREYEYDSGSNHRVNRGYSQNRSDYEDDYCRENYGQRERNYEKNGERFGCNQSNKYDRSDEHRKHDHIEDNSTRKTSYNHQETLLYERHPNSSNMMLDDFEPDRKRGTFSNLRNGRYQQENWNAMRSFDSLQRSREDEGTCTSQHELKAENTLGGCDWPTNELGIKMAIEYLKNKDEVSKSEKQGSNLDNLDEETNLPFIRPEMLAGEALEDLVSDLLNLILTNYGEVTIAKLENKFVSLVNHRFMDPNVLRCFLKRYPQIFEFDTNGASDEEEGEINDDIEIVRAKTVVELCQAHSADPKSCNGDCNSLHVCKFYILSSCEMTNCKFGHILDQGHNKAVRRTFYLHRVDLNNLCLLLRHDANRCSVTIPIVCRFYNGPRGCRSDENSGNQQQQCPFLHICQKFVEGRCPVWSSCRLNHELLHRNCHEILCKYGLDPKGLFNGQNRVKTLLLSSITSFQDKGIMKNVKNRYVPIQQKMNEERARLILKRKMQVGGNDEISMKIQKVMNTVGPASGVSNSLKQNMKENKYESVRNGNTLLNANRVILGTSDVRTGNTARTCENRDFDKNMNIADSNVDQYKHDISNQNIVERRTPSWSLSDNTGNMWKEVSQTALKDLEEKYQTYLAAKTATILVDGK